MAVRISGVGCCLLDRIYGHVDFHSEAFRKCMSKKAGDGGLEPGKLTFEEELERFAGQPFASEILPSLTKGLEADKENQVHLMPKLNSPPAVQKSTKIF